MTFIPWSEIKTVDASPKPSNKFMSDTLAQTLAQMVGESLPPDHPFQRMAALDQAEVCRAAHFFASLRG